MGGGCALEPACSPPGSAELLKRIRRRAVDSDLRFRRIMLVDFGLENNKTKGKGKKVEIL